VLILAAGLGTRLRPLTERIPKPLVPVVDRCILAHQREALRTLGKQCPVDQVYVNAHHLYEQIQAAAASLGIDHVQVEMPDIQGTGAPLRRIVDEGWSGELLILNGDNYHAFDLAAFVEAARSSGDPFALLCVDHDPTNVVGCDLQGHVCARDGKYEVALPVRKLTYSGVAWYSPKALSRITNKDFNVVDYWKREAEAGRLPLAYADQSDRTWIDMGSPEGLYRAFEARLLELGCDRWAHPSVDVSDVVLGPGTVICEQTKIGKGSHLQRCCLLPGANVPAGQRVRDCILGADFQWSI